MPRSNPELLTGISNKLDETAKDISSLNKAIEEKNNKLTDCQKEIGVINTKIEVLENRLIQIENILKISVKSLIGFLISLLFLGITLFSKHFGV